MQVMERQALPYQLLPPLTPEEYEALKEDIRERGVLVPVEYDEAGEVLDGHHRLRACEELGITDFPSLVREGMSEEEKRRHVRALNLKRRHLSQEQRDGLIAEELAEDPTRSNRQIAEMLGVSHPTVGKVRGEMEACGKLFHTNERQRSDGRPYSTGWRDPEPPDLPEEYDPDARLSDESRAYVEEVAREAYREAEARAIEALSSRPPHAPGESFDLDEAVQRVTEALLEEAFPAAMAKVTASQQSEAPPSPTAPQRPSAETVGREIERLSQVRNQRLADEPRLMQCQGFALDIQRIAERPMTGEDFKQHALPYTLQRVRQHIPAVIRLLQEIEKD